MVYTIIIIMGLVVTLAFCCCIDCCSECCHDDPITIEAKNESPLHIEI